MASNITVDGAPLEEFIDKQHRAEIREVLSEEIAVPLNRHQRTKQRTNISRARTDTGRTIYVNGQKETHIIVAGMTFMWHEKAPYVPSGCSTLGAFEYNAESGEIKCHECGAWHLSLVPHILRIHKMTTRDYRTAHGFRMITRLKSPKVPKAAGNPQNMRPNCSRLTHAIRTKGRTSRLMQGNWFSPEVANLRMVCAAQIKAKILALATELGRTPTQAEFKEIGIHYSTARRFGVNFPQLLASLNIAPRPIGGSGHLSQQL